MKTAGIREVKAHLSQYLQDVKNGDEIIITDRGKAVAQIVPMGSSGESGRRYEALSRMSEEDLLILPSKWGKPTAYPKRENLKHSPVSNTVLEDRR